MSIGSFQPFVMIVATAFAVSACATSPLVLSVRQISEQKASFKGRVVTVEGVLHFSPNSRNLWQSTAAYEAFDDASPISQASCIAVFAAAPVANKLSKYDRQQVRLTGRLLHIPLKKDEISLWECSSWGVSVERVTVAPL